jgi:hypothetical protein
MGMRRDRRRIDVIVFLKLRRRGIPVTLSIALGTAQIVTVFLASIHFDPWKEREKNRKGGSAS